MRFTRLQFVLACVLALSACAEIGIGQHGSTGSQDISLRADKSLATDRQKSPDKAKAAPPAALAADRRAENSVYFADGSAALDERDQEVLRRHAAKLTDNRHRVVTLVGYTDSLGSQSYNLAVTEERLDSVADALRSLGVARSQIRRVCNGQAEAQGGSCSSETCRQQMQRVELTYGKQIP